jgi:ADP-heptose:LPS heptosyltransferase
MDVVLARAGALGDLLLLRPTLAALRASGHRVHLLAPLAPGRALVGPGAADTLHASDGPELAAAFAHGFDDGPLARALAEADAVVAFTRSAELLERLADRARRLIAHDPAPPAAGPHAAAWLARAIAPLVGERELAQATALHAPALAFTDEEQREAEALVRDLPSGFLAVHPGSGAPAKNWPIDRWREASTLLANGAPWLFAVGPAEAALPPPEGAILAREWPLRTLGAALSRAGLFVGNDAGVSHLAAAAGSLDGLAVADVVAAAHRLRSASTSSDLQSS